VELTMSQDISGQLLSRLNSGEPAGTVVREMLSQWAESNPSLALLARYFEMREARARELAALEAFEEPATAAAVPMNETIEAELAELRINNDRLAAALGACYLCWGTRIECPNCEGRGSTGWADPDKAMFSELIRPALVRISMRRGQDHSSNGRGAEHKVN
jgi:hypothetical protein